MTDDHTTVTSRTDAIRPVYDSPLTALMPFDVPAVHDIRLRFNVPGIYNALSPLTFIRATFPHITTNRAITLDSSSSRLNHQGGHKKNEEQTIKQRQLLQLRERSKDLVVPLMRLSSGIEGLTTRVMW